MQIAGNRKLSASHYVAHSWAVVGAGRKNPAIPGAPRSAVTSRDRRRQRKIFLGIGNRYYIYLHVVVVERIMRYDTYCLAGYASGVRSHFDSSSGRCLVDRACGSTKWILHGTVLADR